MEDERILDVDGLTVDFDGNKALDSISFSVKKGEVLAIVGPNGAGKSVLFRALLGLVPYSGAVNWQAGIKIGYVPQKLALERALPLTVREFLSLKLKSGPAGDKLSEEATNALASVGIKTGPEQVRHLERHILNRRLGTLSGGEFQRVLIAWSLIGNPDVLLFDEPTSGIDIAGEGTIYNLLHKIQESNELTLILISHDLNIVYKYAGKVICLNKQLVCLGEPHTVLDPKSLEALYGGEAKFYQHEHRS